MNPDSSFELRDSLVFFGTADFSLAALEALLQNEFRVTAVVTKPDSPRGRGRQLTPPEVKTLAEEHRIPVLQPTKLSDVIGDIKQLTPSAGIVSAYGKIIPKTIIDLFPKGLINIHASLLPKYRGASPIEQAILNGDDVTGVCLMQIDEGMDTGPVYDCREIPLRGAETRPELYGELARVGARLLAEKLPAILSGELQPVSQDDSQAVPAPMITKADGVIDWSQPAGQIERQVRAYLGWPGSRTQLAGKESTITAAHISKSPVIARSKATKQSRDQRSPRFTRDDDGNLLVACGDGRYLVIDKLKPAGGKEMTGQGFLAGRSGV